MRSDERPSQRQLSVAAAAVLAAGCATGRPSAVAAPGGCGGAAPVDPGGPGRVRCAALLAAGKVDQAEQGFKNLTRTHPTRRPARRPRSDLPPERQAARGGGRARAGRRCGRARSRRCTGTSLGVAYRQQGRFTQAREAYEQALQIDPDYAAATLNLGILNDLYPATAGAPSSSTSATSRSRRAATRPSASGSST